MGMARRSVDRLSDIRSLDCLAHATIDRLETSVKLLNVEKAICIVTPQWCAWQDRFDEQPCEFTYLIALHEDCSRHRIIE